MRVESPDYHVVEAEAIRFPEAGLFASGVKSGHYVYLVEQGSLKVEMGDVSQSVRSGQIAWLGAGHKRELRARAGSRWIVLRLRNRCFSTGNPGDRIAWEAVLRLGALSRDCPRLPVLSDTAVGLFSIGREMVDWAKIGHLASIPMLKANVLRFLALAMEDRRLGPLMETVQLGGWESGLLQRALIFIEQEGASIQSVAEFALQLGTSRSGLYRVFTSAGLPGPAQLIERSRIEQAGRLLKGTDRTVLDVALSTGFSSLSAFYRAFHRVHGMAPGEWRG